MHFVRTEMVGFNVLVAQPGARTSPSFLSGVCGGRVCSSRVVASTRRGQRYSFHGEPMQPSFEAQPSPRAVTVQAQSAAGNEQQGRRVPFVTVEELEIFLQRHVNLDESAAHDIVIKMPRLRNFPIERPQGAIDFLNKKGIAPEDVARMVIKYPMLLTFDVERRLAPVWKMLEDEGLDAAQVAARYPPIFDHNLNEGIRGKLQALEAAGMSPQALRARVLKEGGATVLRLGAEEKLRPWLSFIAEVGIPPEKLEEIVRRHPWIFKRDLERKVKPMLAVLREDGGLDEAQLAQVLAKCPQLFGFGRDAIVAKLRLLYNIGLTSDEVRHTLLAAPYFLTYDLQTNLKAKVAFLNAAGIRGEDLRTVAAACPVLWGMDLEEEIAPRFDALLNTMGRTVRELLKRPQSLFYASLQRAVLPRHAYLEHRGLDPARVTLQKMLECTDTAFVREVAGGELEEYKEFKRSLGLEPPPRPARAPHARFRRAA
eukprot:tig00020927_g15963.t1